MKRKIEGAIIQGGRLYKAGDEEAFAAVVTPAAVERLTKSGHLSGSWAAPKEEAEGSEDKGEKEAKPRSGGRK